MKRTTDINGFQLVEGNPITKEGVFQYLGSEIANPDAEPNTVYNVYRPADEIEKAADSFKLIPLIDDHQFLGAADIGATPAEDKGVIGTTGESVFFDAPYLRAPLKIFAEYVKPLINLGKKVELSPAYRCDWVKESGVFDGETYDFVQRNLVANHLALVTEGRTGSDVRVLDHRANVAFDTNQLVKEAAMADETQAKDSMAELLAGLSEEQKAELIALLVPAADESEEEAAQDETKEETVVERAEEVAAEAARQAAEGNTATAEELAEKTAEVIEEAKELAADAKSCGYDVTGATPAIVAKAIAKAAGLSCDSIAVVRGFLHGKKQATVKFVADSKPAGVDAKSTAAFIKKGA